jgi:hypothetical protein
MAQYFRVLDSIPWWLKFSLQHQVATGKSEKTKHAHMKMEINENAIKTNTN